MIPGLKNAKDGFACPTTRDFLFFGQSGKPIVSYFLGNNGRTAQNTSQSAILNGTLISSEGNFMIALNEAFGCNTWTVPDLANPGQKSTSLALFELQAASMQPIPIAQVPSKKPFLSFSNST